LAVVVTGRFARHDGTVPIFLAVESPRFRERFGPVIRHFPACRFRSTIAAQSVRCYKRRAAQSSRPEFTSRCAT